MLLSFSLIILVGLSFAAVCGKIRLPRVVGMIFAGIVMGPYLLDLIDPSVLGISSELRKMALVIILVRAGLSLDLSDLRKVGRPAVFMSFLPASFEILGYILFAPAILGISRIFRSRFYSESRSALWPGSRWRAFLNRLIHADIRETLI